MRDKSFLYYILVYNLYF